MSEETKTKKYGILSSSVDPQKLALTVRGIMIAVIPTGLLVSRMFGVELGEGDLNSLVSGVETFIIAVGGVIAAALTLWGVVRKIMVAITKATNKNNS